MKLNDTFCNKTVGDKLAPMAECCDGGEYS